MVPDDELFPSQYAPQQIDADEAWLISRGKDVLIAVIDTGVDHTHPELKDRVTLGKNYKAPNAEAQDDTGHGTMVAGIIAAKGNNQVGVAGLAWDAEILAMKICGKEKGSCDSPLLASAIQEAKMIPNLKIINISIGFPEQSADVAIAILQARRKGILVVAGAGNDGTSTKIYPCADVGVLCVGSATRAGIRSSFSNFGPHVDIAAPGGQVVDGKETEGILTTYSNATIASTWGTSLAAPHVSGVAALVWGHDPHLTRDQVEQRLLRTGTPLPEQQIGPLVNAFDAVFNGGFEDEVSGWTVVGSGNAPVANDVGPIIPMQGARMGMISTGPDGTIFSSELYQSFTLQEDVTRLSISLNYAMLTEEYPEWVGLGFDDHFLVTLETPDGTVHELAKESVDGSSFYPLNGNDLSTGGDSTWGWTDWKSLTWTLNGITPGKWTFRLRVEDRGDGFLDTNAVFDAIRLH